MNNAEVHEAVHKQDPLFYWMKLEDGEHYLIPFICHRCGNCCRTIFNDTCPWFREPNVCLIYDERPSLCRTFPVYSGVGVAKMGCKGYELSQKAIARLRQDMGYSVGYWSGDIYTAPNRLQNVVAKLEIANLPKEFIDKFIELNS